MVIITVNNNNSDNINYHEILEVEILCILESKWPNKLLICGSYFRYQAELDDTIISHVNLINSAAGQRTQRKQME